MTTKHLVDPELLPMLDGFWLEPLTRATLAQARAMSAQMILATKMPLPQGVALSEERVPGPTGAPAVRVLVYRPLQPRGPAPAILHVHGGGYVIGTPEMNEARNAGLVRDLNCVVVSVDYRLPPETPHPGPIEDCYAALKWTHANAARLGIDANRISVAGESAGGGLAAALALLARDRKEVPVHYQALMAPMLDDRTSLASDPHPYVGEFVWTRDNNRFGWSCLLGREPGTADVSPYAAAARAQDLAGLPPTFIAVGALDLFLEENMDYARRLTRAGVPVELHVYPAAYHGYEMTPDAAVTQKAYRDYLDGYRKALACNT